MLWRLQSRLRWHCLEMLRNLVLSRHGDIECGCVGNGPCACIVRRGRLATLHKKQIGDAGDQDQSLAADSISHPSLTFRRLWFTCVCSLLHEDAEPHLIPRARARFGEPWQLCARIPGQWGNVERSMTWSLHIVPALDSGDVALCHIGDSVDRRESAAASIRWPSLAIATNGTSTMFQTRSRICQEALHCRRLAQYSTPLRMPSRGL
jgi:hypothetical protein